MNHAETARFKALATRLAAGATFDSARAIAEEIGCSASLAQHTIGKARAAGLITCEPRQLTTLRLTPAGRKALGEQAHAPPKPRRAAQPKTIAEVADRHVEPPAAPAPVDRWTGAEMRELLDVPHRAVTLVRRALTTPWGPPLLDAIGSLVEESEAVPCLHDHPDCCAPKPARVVAQSAPRIARAPKPKPAPVEEDVPSPSLRAHRGPFRVVDADGDVVRTCKTLAQARLALHDEDADHVLDADDEIVLRGGADDEEES